jgi:ABC-type branched-subunit amino acid transport system substrate-binding protein
MGSLLLGACSDDGSQAAAEGDEEEVEKNEPSGLLADNGPCDESLAEYPIGTMTAFESPVISLIDQVHAAEASVEAFNSRGGIGGHCMELTSCDTKLDTNGEAECARKLVDAGVVATVNDVTAANPASVVAITGEAGLPRVAVTPGPEELAAPNSYPLAAGAVGEALIQFPNLASAGHEKLAVIHLNLPAVQGLAGLVDPMLEAHGAEVVEMIPVPTGTTDYQQFVLKAQEAGADAAVLLLGEAEAVQVIRAAEQLGTDLVLSSGLTSYPRAEAEELGDFASQLQFSSEVPPVTASLEKWPILSDVIADLSASGKLALQRDEIASSSFRSWLAVHALVQVVEQFGDPDDISREAVNAALAKAKDIDFFGVIPPWTPRGGNGEGLLGTVSNPWYYAVTFDPESSEFVIADERINLAEEFAGTTDYDPQPAS